MLQVCSTNVYPKRRTTRLEREGRGSEFGMFAFRPPFSFQTSYQSSVSLCLTNVFLSFVLWIGRNEEKQKKEFKEMRILEK